MTGESSNFGDINFKQNFAHQRFKQIEESLKEMEREAENLYPESHKTSRYRSDSSNDLIMRHLLILFRGKEMRKYRKKVSEQLSFILIQKNGLLDFIRATCDLDHSSEHNTTFDQRFRALSTIITDMPAICCNLEEYYHQLSLQITHNLSLSRKGQVNRQHWKLFTHLFNALCAKNPALGKDKLLKPIFESISCRDSRLSLNEGIICAQRLILSDFDKNQFIPVFPNIFAINLVLADTMSPTKAIVREIIIDLLKYIDHSLYLLDNTLTNHLKLFHQYTTGLINYGEEEILTVIPTTSNCEESRIDLKILDKVVQLTLVLLAELETEYKLDFFLLMLEKINQPTPNHLIFFALIDSLQDEISSAILDHPSKAIQFIANNLRRMESNYNKSIASIINQNEIDVEEEKEILRDSQMIQNDSLSMIIQVISILLEARERLTVQEIQSLKEINVQLLRLTENVDLSDSDNSKIESLIMEIDNLHDPLEKSTANNDAFRDALRCLNSAFMPQRSHGLIVLRKLIDSRNTSIAQNQGQIFTLIKACLIDPDSYVYLAAVNALASLALAYTDTYLPSLIEAYHDRTRSARERVSVGESMVWVCKNLGQMAHHYLRPVVECFLVGLKDEDSDIRVSSLSNLGQFCSTLKNALSYCITEIICAVECLLKTDAILNVKRACLMFIHIMLSGIDRDSLSVISDHLKSIYRLIKSIDSRSLGDDIIRMHAHLALEAIDNLIKSSLVSPDNLIQPINIK